MSLSDTVLQNEKSSILQRFRYSNITVIRITRLFRMLHFCYNMIMRERRAIEHFLANILHHIFNKTILL